MATLDSLQFEMERRVIVFHPRTTMPDDSSLGYNGDPNLIVSPSTPGQELIYTSANGTRFLQTDVSGNTVTEWFKKAQPNGWLPLGSGGGSVYGTDSSTWQLNMDASGVILRDASSNLEIINADGGLATIIVGGLKIGNVTGYLRAIDGSIVVDNSVGNLLTGNGILPGDDNTTAFEIEHNINSENHITMIYESNNNVIYPDISIGTNTDVISFITAPPTGTNYRAVIMGF